VVQISMSPSGWLADDPADGVVTSHVLVGPPDQAGAPQVTATLIGRGGLAVLSHDGVNEQVSFVVRGSGVFWSQDSGELPITVGDAVFVGDGTRHGVRNSGTEPLGLMNSYAEVSPLAAPAADQAQRIDGAHKMPPLEFSSEKLTAERGFTGVAARWLVTRDQVGSCLLCAGQFRFETDGIHRLHRHPKASEYFVVLKGGGVHLTDDGEIPIGPGDATLVHPNEWHGFRSGAEATEVFGGFFGVGKSTEGGYELKTT
jgi:mannose-6-phosphate isomerase-like protein (cupin superfamily)